MTGLLHTARISNIEVIMSRLSFSLLKKRPQVRSFKVEGISLMMNAARLTSKVTGNMNAF